jgi:xylulokinase
MIIAHDLGTTGNKASLHDDSGKIINHCTVDYPVHFASGGVAEQDPNHWWQAVGEATKKLLAASNIHPNEVTAIGISGQMMGAVLLDEDFNPTRSAVIWADHRSTKQADFLIEKIGMDSAYREIGHQLNPTYSLTKVMWVKENQPEIFTKTKYICNAKDYVNAKLTGKLVTDYSDASSTNAFDQVNGRWSERILNTAQIDVALFPEVVPATQILGELTAEAAAHLGLKQSIAVVVGGGDGPMAATGAGIISQADGAYACMGSSSWVSISAKAPLHDPKMRSMTFNHVVPEMFVPTATMQAGGASLHWVADLLMPNGGADRFNVLLNEAADQLGAFDGLYFLPHILGERSPYWNPKAAGAFAGIERHHSRGNLVKSVLEGVAFNLLTCIEGFRENGRAIDSVDVIGGGAESALWMQIFADVWGIPVRQRSIVEEANSLGAAVTTLVALGKVKFEDAAGLSKIKREFAPNQDNHERYLLAHKIFLDSYQRQVEWFANRLIEPK